jgi:hypothetical protein
MAAWLQLMLLACSAVVVYVVSVQLLMVMVMYVVRRGLQASLSEFSCTHE